MSNGLGGALLVVLGVVLLVGGLKGTLLKAAHEIATPIPARGLEIQTDRGPGPGAPGSGVTTQ